MDLEEALAAGYVERHSCDLPPLAVEQVISPLFRTATCPGCGAEWQAKWGRGLGGETQPEWDCITAPPPDWTPPPPPLPPEPDPTPPTEEPT